MNDQSTQGTHEWALEQAKSGKCVRRACWPFFAYLKATSDGHPCWTNGPAGHWSPDTLDPEHDGKATDRGTAVGQTIGWPKSTYVWQSVADWETCEPTWGHTPQKYDFIVDGIDADADVMPYWMFDGHPPAGAVRELQPGEGTRDWSSLGVTAYALA